MTTPHVSDLMSRTPLHSIAPDALASHASRLAADAGVSHLLVVEGTDLVGIVCTCDLLQARDNTPVGSCMNWRPVTTAPGARAPDAARLMLDYGVHCLPVLSEGRLAGILTMGDLRRAGWGDAPIDHCASCGSSDHVRAAAPGNPGYCLECTRRSLPFGHDAGGGG